MSSSSKRPCSPTPESEPNEKKQKGKPVRRIVQLILAQEYIHDGTPCAQWFDIDKLPGGGLGAFIRFVDQQEPWVPDFAEKIHQLTEAGRNEPATIDYMKALQAALVKEFRHPEYVTDKGVDLTTDDEEYRIERVLMATTFM